MRTLAGLIGLTLGILIGPCVAHAQTASATEVPPDSKPVRAYIIARDMPYSGVRVVHSVTAFPNGYRKVEDSATKEWRDSEGRTRNDITWEDMNGRKVTVCEIDDPVALVRYIWKVGSTTKTIVTETHYKMDGIVNEVWPDPVHITEANPGTKLMVLGPQQDPSTTNAALGYEYINGVYAEGSRSVHVIPPGRGGNGSDHPVQRIDESWMAPDLGMPVKMFLDDGLGFTQSVELKNIDRSEPDQSVFLPPEQLPKRVAPESDPVWKEPIGP